MTLVPVPLNPGVYVDDTPLKAQGFFTTANKCRFVRGLPQIFGGYELYTSTLLTGYCRGLHSWMDANLVKWIGAGTHTNLYALTDSSVYDITPVSSYGTLTNPFTTTISVATVSVAHNAHGRSQGDGVFFSNATAVGGLTISGAYTVTSVTSANAYVITASSVATSSAGPGGGTVYYKYFLAIGLADDIGALGYSTGVYSTGSTYSGAGTGDTFPRTWSISNLGALGIFSPRNGYIYEWVPITSSPQLVTNYDFSAGIATGWTFGTGWTFTGFRAQSTLSSAAVSQVALITTQPNSFNLAEVVVESISTGTLTLTLGSQTILSTTAAGKYSAEFYAGAAGTNGILSVNATSATCSLSSVSLTQAATASIMLNAPIKNTVVLVTAEGFVMTFGTIATSTGLFDPMHIRWSDIGSVAASQHIWTPSPSNLSAFVTLRAGSRIVGAKLSNNEILVWTDKALYAGTYVNNSAIVYNFRLVGTNCGLIGPNAAAVLGGISYWMDATANIWSYSGGAPQPIKSTMSKDVFDHLALVQQDKIYASAISQFKDVMWLYPDSRDGNENSRYSLLCTTEAVAPPQNTNPGTYVGCFAPGTYNLTAMMDSSLGLPYPISVDTTGAVRIMEKGNTANGGNIVWLLQTGAIQIGTGATLFKVNSFVPDFAGLVGGGSLTAYGYKFPQSTPSSTGPFAFTSATERVDMNSGPPIGRQVAFLFQGNSSPASMRTGVLMMDIEDTGMAN